MLDHLLQAFQKRCFSRTGLRSVPIPSPDSLQSNRQVALLVLLSALQFALFGILARMLKSHHMTRWDRQIFHTYSTCPQQSRNSPIEFLSTLLGEPVLLNTAIFSLATLFWRKELRLEAACAPGTTLLANLLRMVFRNLVGEPRPSMVLCGQEQGQEKKSFPSGHVTASLVFWSWISVTARVLSPSNKRLESVLRTAPLLFIIFIGPSRIALGKHWASDVVGGYLLGGGCFSLSLALYTLLQKQKQSVDKEGQDVAAL